jgi:hypothetical protein
VAVEFLDINTLHGCNQTAFNTHHAPCSGNIHQAICTTNLGSAALRREAAPAMGSGAGDRGRGEAWPVRTSQESPKKLGLHVHGQPTTPSYLT